MNRADNSIKCRSKSPPHPGLASIRDQIRQAIKAQGYTSVEKFAHENGLEQSVLSRFLSGRNDILLSTYLRIAAALELSEEPMDLTLEIHPPPRSQRLNMNEHDSFHVFASNHDDTPLFSIHHSTPSIDPALQTPSEASHQKAHPLLKAFC